MQLVQDNPEFRYILRGVSATGVLVNNQTIARSFLLTPNQLITDWRPRHIDDVHTDDWQAALALQPSVILLGSGARLRFPSAEVMAAVLSRGIGLETMDSAAAARTFNVLATEGRKVLAAFLLPD